MWQRMLTLFVRNLPSGTTEANLTELFGSYGKVHALKLSRDMFTGKARGTATVNMEGHEARAAIKGLNGTESEGKTLYVDIDKGPSRARRRH
jgi:RNA recognition motif-containing protein